MDVYPVSGTVTLFGKPLSGATVAFAPRDKQPTAFGTTDAEGNFVLTTYDMGDGAAEGKFGVVIRKTVSVAKKTTEEVTEEVGEDGREGHDSALEDDGGHAAAMSEANQSQSLVPSAYTKADTTPLDADVKPGEDNVFTFDVQ